MNMLWWIHIEILGGEIILIEFQTAFMKSPGKPIQYNGKTLIAIDRLTVPEKFQMRIKIISIDSKWKQGVRIKIEKGKGNFYSHSSDKKDYSFVIWEETVEAGYPTLAEHEGLLYSGTARNNEVKIWNVWDEGNGVTQAWIMGAAMIKETIAENHFRYHCNDGQPNDDFSDIVFDVIISPDIA